jgi:hypothetical protein
VDDFFGCVFDERGRQLEAALHLLIGKQIF